MILFPLLAPMFFIPGLDQFQIGRIWFGDRLIAIDQKVGSGAPFGPNASITLDFTLRDGLGRTLADTKQRGLPYRFHAGDSDLDPLLKAAIEGLRPGGSRRVMFDSTFLDQGIGSLVPAHTDLILDLTAVGR